MNPQTTATFTGYRSAKILKSAPNNPEIMSQITARLDATIEELYDNGYRTFLSGMAIGFDMMAAESVLKAKRAHADIELVAVVPFKNQHSRYSAKDKIKYEKLMTLANQIVIIEPKMSYAAYFNRNIFLIENASVIVCYYNGQKGGTQYTVEYGQWLGKTLINLF